VVSFIVAPVRSIISLVVCSLESVVLSFLSMVTCSVLLISRWLMSQNSTSSAGGFISWVVDCHMSLRFSLTSKVIFVLFFSSFSGSSGMFDASDRNELPVTVMLFSKDPTDVVFTYSVI
jgi:hypothetical protein